MFCLLLAEIKRYANESNPFRYFAVLKGVDLTGLLGGHKRRLRVWGTGSMGGSPVEGLGTKSHSRIQGRSPSRGSGSPPEAETFLWNYPNICIKIQQTTVAVTRVDILNDITSKILGAITMDAHFINIGGTCPPFPLGSTPLAVRKCTNGSLSLKTAQSESKCIFFPGVHGLVSTCMQVSK